MTEGAEVRSCRDVGSRVPFRYIRGSSGRERHELVRLPVTTILRDRAFGLIIVLANTIQDVHELRIAVGYVGPGVRQLAGRTAMVSI